MAAESKSINARTGVRNPRNLGRTLSSLLWSRNFVDIPQGPHKKTKRFHGILQLKRRSGDRTWDRSTVVIHPALGIRKTLIPKLLGACVSGFHKGKSDESRASFLVVTRAQYARFCHANCVCSGK